ncbi:hypothetical protein K488DRAFT_73018 [Vararia minispora EC-137]|uniref:Uncharacterized protein n=1 Tax=Vararia minispora EC-137 TaxID=1314806 RepID=A0ACB8QC14_9AGAM|nr:hypothetical protein K488DRAFT_73018 [Vararia minispora EC-137]
MDLTADLPCIISAAYRLPGNLAHPSALFARFQSGDWPAASTLPPRSHAFHLHSQQHPSMPGSFGHSGWFAAFFHIPPTESPTLRPNVRLALELTYNALLHTGIPPSSLHGKNVTVAFSIGTEDGWDIRRTGMDNDGVLLLLHNGAKLAIVGTLVTHFSPASFLWAQVSGVASSSSRCASFSPDADGYSPSVRLSPELTPARQH